MTDTRTPENVARFPQGTTFEEYEPRDERERRANGADDQGPRERLALRYLADIQPRGGSDYIVKQWLNRGEFAVMTGAAGCGKTHVATDWAFHVAAERPWRGYRVKRAGVIFIAAEGGTAIEHRIEANKRDFGGASMLPLAIISDSVDLCHGDDDAMLLIARCEEAAAHFTCEVGLVFVDTLSRALAGGDENGPQDMGAFVRCCDLLRDRTGAAVVAVHHVGKDANRGARGHSLLRAAVDTEIVVTRDDATKAVRVHVDKQRNGPSGAEAFVALEVVDLGVDGDGDAITACRVVDAMPSATKERDDVKLSAPCAIALSALRQAVDEAGEIPPANAHIPAGVRTVHVELWRRFAYAKAISDGKPNAKRMAFNRASGQLQARGIVGCWTDQVWPVDRPK